MHRPHTMTTPTQSTPIPAGLFITGTTAGCGKTIVAAGIIHRLRSRGLVAAGMKPVATGCRETPSGPRSHGAELLLVAAGLDLDYDQVNPYAFIPPVAPHLAAREAGVAVDAGAIWEAFRTLQRHADCVVVEGVGGWVVPLGPDYLQADLARVLALPVVMVVSLRPGCIDQASTTARAIRDDGLPLSGWIANAVEAQVERPGASLVSLRERLAPVPCLGVVDHHAAPDPEAIARHLRFDRLMTAMAADDGIDQADENSR